jgi:hypothetical protein
MELIVNLENSKKPLFLEMLNLLKKDRMIEDFKIVEDGYDSVVLSDLKQFGDTYKNAMSGDGDLQNKYITIKE